MVVPLVKECQIALCFLWILVHLKRELNGLKTVQQMKNFQLLSTITNAYQKEIPKIIRIIILIR